MVTTRKDGVVTNITTAITTLANALDQAKADQSSALAGLTWLQSNIVTSTK